MRSAPFWTQAWTQRLFWQERTSRKTKCTSFSWNYVSLQISGKDLADLAFVDLPGFITSVGQTGHAYDIDLVKSLVTSYIKNPSCVTLLTVACESLSALNPQLCSFIHPTFHLVADFENQGAHHLAKQFDPEGKRTIGKPLELQAYVHLLELTSSCHRCAHQTRSNSVWRKGILASPYSQWGRTIAQ